MPVEEGPEAGRPRLVPDVGLAVSITHSGGLALAAVGAEPAIGIDAEPTSLRWEASFDEEAFMPGERQGFAAALPGLPSGVAAWCVKEAALKVWGVGLRAPLQRVRVMPEAATRRDDASGVGLRAMLEVPEEIEKALGPAPCLLALRLFFRGPLLVALAVQSS
jgi:4'-phosphopantetheinyl transferase